jgi:hypothetical protein
MVSEQAPVPEQSPDHPAKLERAVADAVRLTEVLSAN